MSLRQYSFSTVGIHVSTISYFNKINNLVDNTKQFIVNSMLEGFRRLSKRYDTRHPITQNVLIQLLSAVPNACRSQYECLMFSDAFCLAYIGLLRISEFALPSKK